MPAHEEAQKTQVHPVVVRPSAARTPRPAKTTKHPLVLAQRPRRLTDPDRAAGVHIPGALARRYRRASHNAKIEKHITGPLDTLRP